MKKLLIALLVVILVMACWRMFGYSSQPSLLPFTGISVVEIGESNTSRIYHFRRTHIPVGFDLRTKLYVIDGVRAVYLVPYKFTVERSKVYSWDEIEPKIKSVLLELEEEIKKDKELEEKSISL